MVPPTPLAPGSMVIHNDFRIVLLRAEISGEYVSQYGSVRQPAAGAKYLWVEVSLQNQGTRPIQTPGSDHYSVLFYSREIKPSYGHRQDYQEYTALDTTIYPGETLQAWLRFEIPETAQISDFRFAYMPDSVRVSLAAPETDTPWARHSLYLWNLTP